jgi:hypothetical protein
LIYTQKSTEKGRALCWSPIFAHTGRVPARAIKTAGGRGGRPLLACAGKNRPKFFVLKEKSFWYKMV